MAARRMEKDPQAILDYRVDWTTWLNGDTINASSWTAETGITITAQINDTKVAVVWLSGGTAGTTYSVTNHITTALGRQDERTLNIVVKNK